MDVYEATRIVLSRIQSLDPTNASKIMGLLLLQDHGEKEMIRLAFGPQNLVQSVIAKAKTELGLMASSTLNPASLPFYAGRDDFELPFESDLGLEWGGHYPHVVDETLDRSRIELLRSKSVPPRLAHHFNAASCFPFSPKSVNLQQSDAQRAAAALMMGDELHKLGRWRPERIDLSAMACPASRQIYLTFPADSIFREEDVSNYFSTYGPVQDVRIPYQQKRMFGFVTFVYPETVKSILAKGNPHFVCDSRVLVKPYKEKGKVPDKYRTKPPSPDDSMDLQLGGRAFHEDLLWRRRVEERALELQSRRLMNLQLLDVKKHFQLGFDQTHVSPRLDNSLSPLSVNRRVSPKENENEDTIKLPQSLEDRLPDSPFDESAADTTNGSDSSPPSFDNDDSNSATTSMSESFKSFNCQMPRLSMIGGMLPSTDGQTCRVGI